MLRLGLAAESMSHPKRVASTFNSGIYEGIDMKKLVYGVGINDADYVVQKRETSNGVSKIVWSCKYYSLWLGMLSRCYGVNSRNTSYKDSFVCDEWLSFMSFRHWVIENEIDNFELDKDLKVVGNKEYSPDKCLLIPSWLNKFINETRTSRFGFMTGVTIKDGKYRSRCRNTKTGNTEHIGYFDSEISAHNAWKARKLELARELVSDRNLSEYLSSLLIKRYSNGN